MDRNRVSFVLPEKQKSISTVIYYLHRTIANKLNDHTIIGGVQPAYDIFYPILVLKRDVYLDITDTQVFMRSLGLLKYSVLDTFMWGDKNIDGYNTDLFIRNSEAIEISSKDKNMCFYIRD